MTEKKAESEPWVLEAKMVPNSTKNKRKVGAGSTLVTKATARKRPRQTLKELFRPPPWSPDKKKNRRHGAKKTEDTQVRPRMDTEKMRPSIAVTEKIRGNLVELDQEEKRGAPGAY